MENYLYSVVTDKAKGLLAEVIKFALVILSWFYTGLVFLQDLTYRFKLLKPTKVKLKVISVGNITWGGTGKTSMIQLLAKVLSGQGKKVAILSRGYRSQVAGPKSPLDLVRLRSPQVARDRQASEGYKLMGDEPYLLAQKFPNIPVIAARDRIKSAQEALKTHQAQVVLLDDGFQHRRLYRDLDIVLIDVLNPFGNGYLIPRGILREPQESLKRAQVVVLTNCEFDRSQARELSYEIREINSQALIVWATYRFLGLQDALTKEGIVPTYLVGRPVCLLASIGNFLSFKKTLATSIGARVVLEFDFPDHYEYKKADLDKVDNACIQQGVNTIITTEKDAVRLRPYLSEPLGIKILILEARLEIIDKNNEFLKAITDVFID